LPEKGEQKTEGKKPGSIAARGNCIKTEFYLIHEQRRQLHIARRDHGGAVRTRRRMTGAGKAGTGQTNQTARTEVSRGAACAAATVNQARMPAESKTRKVPRTTCNLSEVGLRGGGWVVTCECFRCAQSQVRNGGFLAFHE
jgi:hypothetical protein